MFPHVEEFIRLCGKPVYISCPISRKSLPEFAALRDYWMSRGAHKVRALPLSSRCTETLNYYDLSVAAAPGCCRQEVAADLIIDADGSVLTCCNDFLKQNKIGDLTRETVGEVLSNDARKEVFDKLRVGRLGDFLSCRECKIDSFDAVEQLLPS